MTVRHRWIAASAAVATAVLVSVLIATTGHSSTREASSARQASRSGTTSTTSTRSTSTGASKPQGPGVVPQGAWALPSPTHFDGTAGVGFPHSTLGAVAMGYSSLSAQVSVNPDIAASVVRATYMSPSPAQVQEAAQVVENARSNYGLPPTGPTAATIDLSLEACKVESSSANQVVAGFEGTLVVEGPSIQGTTSNFAKALTLAWDGTDWRIDPNASVPQPTIAFPGSPQAAGDGWHPCSEV